MGKPKTGNEMINAITEARVLFEGVRAQLVEAGPNDPNANMAIGALLAADRATDIAISSIGRTPHAMWSPLPPPPAQEGE